MTQPTFSVKEDQQSRLTLRQDLLKIRKETRLEQRQEWDLIIGKKLCALLTIAPPSCLAVYWPIKAEPNLQLLYQQLQISGINLALPIVEAKERPLKFVPWVPGDLMDVDDFGIPIPRQRTCYVVPTTLLVPCVGFNKDKFRLGYGGGFYDRTLEQLPQAQAIGVAYQIGFTTFLPNAFDLAMHHIVTESAG
jgi:5-formyltetrahydrofolate cyclo-ligase